MLLGVSVGVCTLHFTLTLFLIVIPFELGANGMPRKLQIQQRQSLISKINTKYNGKGCRYFLPSYASLQV